MADKIHLSGMVFYGFHGVSPAEQEVGQRFVVDLEVHLDLRAAGLSDRLPDTASYTELYNVVKDILEGPSRLAVGKCCREHCGAPTQRVRDRGSEGQSDEARGANEWAAYCPTRPSRYSGKERSLSPNPPKDTDGRREESGRGVREIQGK